MFSSSHSNSEPVLDTDLEEVRWLEFGVGVEFEFHSVLESFLPGLASGFLFLRLVLGVCFSFFGARAGADAGECESSCRPLPVCCAFSTIVLFCFVFYFVVAFPSMQ